MHDPFLGRSLFGPTLGDRLLASAHGATIEILRAEEDGQAVVAYTLRGLLPDDGEAAATAMGLIRELRQPKNDAGPLDGKAGVP